MKHNTHIYLAQKAIEFLYDACGNLYDLNENEIAGKRKRDTRAEAKMLQRLLQFHEHEVLEASWAPDDIVCDKAIYHTFKLFTKTDFTDAEAYALETHQYNGSTFYRAKQGGGLPFKIDHLAKLINDMIKLRKYNDAFSMKGIMYMMLMLSHYVIDAHVPMHCDLRDDSPKDWTPKQGKYYDDKYHGKLEKEWDVVTTEYAVESGCIDAERNCDYKKTNGREVLKSKIAFDLKVKDHIDELKVYDIPNNKLMSFIIDVCIKSKERNGVIFGKGEVKPNMEQFENLTREIYADCLGDLISIWLYIWKN